VLGKALPNGTFLEGFPPSPTSLHPNTWPSTLRLLGLLPSPCTSSAARCCAPGAAGCLPGRKSAELRQPARHQQAAATKA